MTITDIMDIKESILECGQPCEAAAILDECGEDSDDATAKKVFDSVRNTDENGFFIKDGAAYFMGKAIKCPSCGNTSPNTILSSNVELLLNDPDSRFGCCECGEQFTVR